MNMVEILVIRAKVRLRPVLKVAESYLYLMLRNLKNSKAGSESEIPRKSRRDDTLLTVGFNLRLDAARHVSTKSRRDDTWEKQKCRPCGTLGASATFHVRRLKSTVNRVLSLRDLSFDMVRLRNMSSISTT